MFALPLSLGMGLKLILGAVPWLWESRVASDSMGLEQIMVGFCPGLSEATIEMGGWP